MQGDGDMYLPVSTSLASFGRPASGSPTSGSPRSGSRTSGSPIASVIRPATVGAVGYGGTSRKGQNGKRTSSGTSHRGQHDKHTSSGTSHGGQHDQRASRPSLKHHKAEDAQIASLKQQADAGKEKLGIAYDVIQQRKNQMEKVAEEARELHIQSGMFRKSAENVHRLYWWKNVSFAWKVGVGLFLVLVLAAVGVVVFISSRQGGGDGAARAPAQGGNMYAAAAANE